MLKVLIATRNRDKMKEIRALLKGLDIKLYSLWDLPQKLIVEETGSTFCQNAALKAESASLLVPWLCVGEDSGLEVDYLGGRPGVYSARYAGESCSYDDNNRKLLAELEGVPFYKRKAKFVTCLALAKGGKSFEFFEGSVRGRIAFKAQGRFGFGYDPLFYLERHHKTMAQLRPEEKNRISHRHRAFVKFKNYLKKNLHKLKAGV